MRQLTMILKTVSLLVLGWSLAMPSHSQIPVTNKAATTEFDGVTVIDSLQLVNLSVLESTTGRGRLNVWGGLSPNAIVGNYTSDLWKAPQANELWSAWLIADGRFTLRPQGRKDLCATAETSLTNTFEAEFGEAARVVRVKKCSASTSGQQFFLQNSISGKNAPFGGVRSFVVRLVDDPTMCLSNFINSAKSAALSPVTVETCSQAGSLTDRWVIAGSSSANRAKADAALNRISAFWAMHNYAESGHSIYNNSVTSEAKKGSVIVSPDTKYTRLSFSSPFSGQPVGAYTNATPEQQELHIERFDTSGFDKSLEISGGNLSKLIGFGWIADIKGKMDWKSSTQENVKLWQKVPAYSTMYFVAGTVKVAGGFTLNVITDLGDKWSIDDGGKFSQDVVSVLVACTDTSTSQICALSTN